MKTILSSKRHRYLAKISIFLITVALIAGMAGCGASFTGGNGTAEDPYQIANWHHLHNVRDYPNACFILINDLNSTTAGYEELASPTANQGKGWEPIGGTYDDSFTGFFDGQGYEIKDLFIDRPEEAAIGLFGFVGEEGVVKNVGVVNVTVTAAALAGGGLVGANRGSVSNSYSTGNVNGSSVVGGLIGYSFLGTVSHSYSTGNVTGSYLIGGLVGVNYEVNIKNSYYNYDEVLINGENIITLGALFDEDFEEWLANGKLLDINERLSKQGDYYVINNVDDFQQLLAFGQDGSLKFRLANDLDLASEPNFYIPYLAGEFDGNGHTISNLSVNFDFLLGLGLFGYLAPGGKVTNLGVENVNITGDQFIGGLAGENSGNLSNSYSTGSVTGNQSVGGLVGANSGTVSNSYSTGSTIGLGEVGGLVGLNVGNVVNSYSTGSVSGNNFTGGLVGINYDTVSDSFWDTETSGQATSDGGTGKNTTEMKNITTFSGATWNITTVGGTGERNTGYIWNIVDSVTYPFLSWQPV